MFTKITTWEAETDLGHFMDTFLSIFALPLVAHQSIIIMTSIPLKQFSAPLVHLIRNTTWSICNNLSRDYHTDNLENLFWLNWGLRHNHLERWQKVIWMWSEQTACSYSEPTDVGLSLEPRRVFLALDRISGIVWPSHRYPEWKNENIFTY